MKKALLFVILPLLVCAAFSAQADRDYRGHRHIPGYKVKVLPPGYHQVVHRRRTYYYERGVFYRPSGGFYVVVNAPIGVYVDSIPRGYISFGIGTNRYFFAQGVYYLALGDRYEVVRKPSGADAAVVRGTVEKEVPSELIIYPKAGQDLATMDRDRYECHLWGVHESRFDPSLPNQDLSRRSVYDRAMAACLEGRDYVVK